MTPSNEVDRQQIPSKEGQQTPSNEGQQTPSKAGDRQLTPSNEVDRQQTPSKGGELTLSQEGELTPSACRPPDTPNSAWSDGIPAAADDDELVGDSLREPFILSLLF